MSIIGMNLFVSLVLDTFLIKWDAVYNHRKQEEEEGELDAELDADFDSNTWEAFRSGENMVGTLVCLSVCLSFCLSLFLTDDVFYFSEL